MRILLWAALVCGPIIHCRADRMEWLCQQVNEHYTQRPGRNVIAFSRGFLSFDGPYNETEIACRGPSCRDGDKGSGRVYGVGETIS